MASKSLLSSKQICYKRSPRCIFLTLQDETGMFCLVFCCCCIICNPQLFSHLCCFLYTFSSLPPTTFTAPGSVGGSAPLQRGRSAELQITRCTPKHRQAFSEPLHCASTDRFGPLLCFVANCFCYSCFFADVSSNPTPLLLRLFSLFWWAPVLNVHLNSTVASQHLYALVELEKMKGM